MITLEIIWTQSALNDLNVIIEFISQISVQTASRVANKILSRTNQLSKFPLSGQLEPALAKTKYQYRYIIEGHSKIIYRFDGAKLYIERVFDTLQSPEKLTTDSSKK